MEELSNQMLVTAELLIEGPGGLDGVLSFTLLTSDNQPLRAVYKLDPVNVTAFSCKQTKVVFSFSATDQNSLCFLEF